MRRILITHLLLLCLPIYFGCSSLQPISKSSWSSITNKKDIEEIEVQTKTGERYLFKLQDVSFSQDSIFGVGVKKIDSWHEYSFEGAISLFDIQSIRTSQFDLTTTLVLFGMLAILIVAFLLAASEGMSDMELHW